MNLLISCGNIKNELSGIVDKFDIKMDVVWMDSRLHNKPRSLHEAIQKEIDKSKEYENILLGFGNCGNCLIGINSNTSRIVIPYKNDCIDIFLHRDKNLLIKRKNTYYLIKSWIENAHGLISEYNYYMENYGDLKCKRIMSRMFKNYSTLAFISTSTNDYVEYNEILRHIGKELGLKVDIEMGNFELYEKLVSGNWDDDFIIVDKGMPISQSDFT